ncbi:TetR/AcrR family transcriptional regulator [Actinomadura rugatobispora]|uniref:TetR/AcrR family transcriptional regulator n=1 Tax=Actinomadura rugatobispora TaxID=1994 RepID=A0ABW0ZS01_9ACTN|nr:TetR family transcriptional regulator [Actinomadura rugatobispora]
MGDPKRATTRSIARTAIRAELAQVAIELFRRDGFEQVTISDVAAAAGVSRSTFLRYFGSKEEAVLGAMDVQGVQAAAALRARPAGEDDWTALRRTLDPFIDSYRQNPGSALALARLVQESPALRVRQLEKRASWLPALAEALSRRSGHDRPTPLAPEVRAAAALDCLSIAVAHWTASDGELDLAELLDQAFAALTTP